MQKQGSQLVVPQSGLRFLLTRISVLALARPQYTSAPARMPRLFALNPAHQLRR